MTTASAKETIHDFDCIVHGNRGNIRGIIGNARYHFWFPLNNPDEIDKDLCGRKRTLYKVPTAGFNEEGYFPTRYLNPDANPKIVKALKAQIPLLLPGAIQAKKDEEAKEQTEMKARRLKGVKEEYAEKMFNLLQSIGARHQPWSTGQKASALVNEILAKANE